MFFYPAKPAIKSAKCFGIRAIWNVKILLLLVELQMFSCKVKGKSKRTNNDLNLEDILQVNMLQL